MHIACCICEIFAYIYQFMMLFGTLCFVICRTLLPGCVWMLAAVSHFGLQQHYNCQLSWWYKGDRFTHSLTLTTHTHTYNVIWYKVITSNVFWFYNCNALYNMSYASPSESACRVISLLKTEEVLTQLEWFCPVKMRRKRGKKWENVDNRTSHSNPDPVRYSRYCQHV